MFVGCAWLAGDPCAQALEASWHVVTLQAAKEAQEAKDSQDPAAWKKSFVRAMNHLANCSARPAAPASDTGASDAGQSVAASHITEGTKANEARSQAAREKRQALVDKESEPEWDRSTRAGDVNAQRLATSTAQTAEELVRENPELAYVHSAQSLRTVVAKHEAALKMQACA
jgi:hypothetical protein